MPKIPNSNTVICDGCGVEIGWSPILYQQRLYCCRACASGMECACDYPPEENGATKAQPAVLVFSE